MIVADTDTPNQVNGAKTTEQTAGDAHDSHWLGRPDPQEKPLGFWHVFVIILSGHLGVRTRAQREEDFRRANGLHIVIAAFIYFALVVGGLVTFVNWIAAG
jgi:hypothetical protein